MLFHYILFCFYYLLDIINNHISYIYYNINKSNNPGYLDRNIRDRIYRFRINANAYSKIAEQDKDPKLQNHTEHKRKLTVDEIRKKIWKRKI